jgi:hypothetical protein
MVANRRIVAASSPSVWEAMLGGARASAVDVHFVPLTVGAHLFAACPNPHYDSLGVTWIDVIAIDSKKSFAVLRLTQRRGHRTARVQTARQPMNLV